MKTLISMTDFILEQSKILNSIYKQASSSSQIHKSRIDYIFTTQNYANFLKQPLTLGMFIPVDDDGSVVSNVVTDINYFGIHIYEKAKEKVLFEFERVNPQDIMDQFSTIEDMANFYEPELTESALKQIYENA